MHTQCTLNTHTTHTRTQVGNYSVKLFMQTKDAKWTKALKLMLADLKVALQWQVRVCCVVASRAESSAAVAVPAFRAVQATHAIALHRILGLPGHSAVV